MEVIEDISRYVKKQKFSKSTDESFSTPMPKTICPCLKIGLCNLFPALLECITYLFKVRLARILSKFCI